MNRELGSKDRHRSAARSVQVSIILAGPASPQVYRVSKPFDRWSADQWKNGADSNKNCVTKRVCRPCSLAIATFSRSAFRIESAGTFGWPSGCPASETPRKPDLSTNPVVSTSATDVRGPTGAG